MSLVQLLDGAVGTLLEQRGYPGHPVLWTAEAAMTHPDMLRDIHLAYLDAGADIITAHTFRTTAYAYHKAGRSDQEAHQALDTAVSIAKQCIVQSERKVILAGSLAPVEDCYRPDLVPDDNALLKSHQLQIQWLKASGVDLILAETINTLQEAEVILSCCIKANIPAWISLLPGPDSSFNEEEILHEAIDKLWNLGASMVLLNCRPHTEMNDWLKVFSDAGKPWGIYANGPGAPDPACGWDNHDQEGIEGFVRSAMYWISQGAFVLGGCCGSTPEMIRAIRQNLHINNTQEEF